MIFNHSNLFRYGTLNHPRRIINLYSIHDRYLGIPICSLRKKEIADNATQIYQIFIV